MKRKKIGMKKKVKITIMAKQKQDQEKLYKDLAIIKNKINLALEKIGNIKHSDEFSEAVFNSGGCYIFLDEANDKLEDILEAMYTDNNYTSWQDIIND